MCYGNRFHGIRKRTFGHLADIHPGAGGDAPQPKFNASPSALAARGKVRMGKFCKQPFNFSTYCFLNAPCSSQQSTVGNRQPFTTNDSPLPMLSSDSADGERVVLATGKAPHTQPSFLAGQRFRSFWMFRKFQVCSRLRRLPDLPTACLRCRPGHAGRSVCAGASLRVTV